MPRGLNVADTDPVTDGPTAPSPALFSGIVPGAPYWAVSPNGWQWVGAYFFLFISGFVLYRCFMKAGKQAAAARAHRLFHLAEKRPSDEKDPTRVSRCDCCATPRHPDGIAPPMGWLVAAKPHAVLSAEGWANGLPPSHAGPGLDSAARAVRRADDYSARCAGRGDRSRSDRGCVGQNG